jgi:hypothetical protein
VNDAKYKLFCYMDFTANPVPFGESAVVDSAVHSLTLLGYFLRTRMARTRADIPLTICGQDSHAKTDVFIVDSDDILLLGQGDKRHKEPNDPEPQLIAGAIAAFKFKTNNYGRTRILGRYPIAHKVMPGITLKGTSPISYKIPPPLTELAQSVALGVYPAAPAIPCTILIISLRLPALAAPPLAV